MKCKICSNESNFVFNGLILEKYKVSYFYCEKCGFLQTEEPYWLEEAYNDSINISDTGILQRNITLSKITSNIINVFFDRDKKFLDFAGGYGIFTRLMRDIGFDFYWNDKFSKNLVSRGFEDKRDCTYELVSSFESFEHFVEPIAEIEQMLEISDSILFTTELFENRPPNLDSWDYYGLNHGQHISFYSMKTFEYISKRYELNFFSDGNNIHLLTKKRVNKSLFKLVIKLNRFGLFNILKRKNSSKTLSDWEMLK